VGSTVEKFEVAVIGAGPGGYVAAIRAAQLGKKVCLIEKELLGGTCLNVGCIPTKALLSKASALREAKKLEDSGISVGSIKIEYEKLVASKDKVVSQIRSGLELLIQSNKIQILKGSASFISSRELKITGPTSKLIEADKVIIATGSSPVDIKAFPCDHKTIFNSSSILDLKKIPKTLAIVGGGYIGCEFATFFHEMGTKVTIIEMMDSILSLQGPTIAQNMTQLFAQKGINLKTKSKVSSIVSKGTHAEVVLESGALEAEAVLICVGRKVFVEGLGLDKIALQANPGIEVNNKMETSIPGIYAIGDVVQGNPMLAHVASHQAIIAAENACGGNHHQGSGIYPAVVFTDPEVATVGLTEPKEGMVLHKFPFSALGKAKASNHEEGFVQLISDPKTGEIFGATVIGHEASNLISEITLAIENELTVESIVQTIHAHPTMAESWHEAASLSLGFPIHLPKKG
jgi:dihydrolipoamide dehydrogenase